MSQRIVADPETVGGKPRLEGTRISVEFLLELMASGASRDVDSSDRDRAQWDGFELPAAPLLRRTLDGA